MIRAPLYLSYGMPKSGSTLAFELTRTMLELAGVRQERIAPELTQESNFVLRLDGEALKTLKSAAGETGGPVVIKTHSIQYPRAGKMLARGALSGHAVCRDPRDMALSMLDAAREGRAWGKGPDGPFRNVPDTIKLLHACVRSFNKWAESPNVIPIHYERLAFDTESVAREIAAQLGIDVDIPKAIEIAVGSKFIQFNRGTSQRWKSEMDAADARLLEAEFGDFIRTWCHDIPAAPKPRKPSRGLFARWFPRRT